MPPKIPVLVLCPSLALSPTEFRDGPLWDAIDETPKDVTADDLEGFEVDAEMKLVDLGNHESKVERSIEYALAFVSVLPDLVSPYRTGAQVQEKFCR